MSRDSLFALFAATLGVSAACNHDGDAPPVSAHEVPAFADAAVAPSATVIPTIDSDAGSATATAPTDDAIDAGALVDANVAVDVAPFDAGIVTSTRADAMLPVAWFRSMGGVSSGTPLPPPPLPPAPPSGLGRINPRASCGAVAHHEPTVEIAVMLAPRSDLDGAARARASVAVSIMRRRVGVCLDTVARTADGSTTVLLVRARAPGHRGTTLIDVSPSVPAQVRSCIAKVLVAALGGDEEPVSPAFNITKRVSDH